MGHLLHIIVVDILDYSPFNSYHQQVPRGLLESALLLERPNTSKILTRKNTGLYTHEMIDHFTLNPSLTISPCLMEKSILSKKKRGVFFRRSLIYKGRKCNENTSFIEPYHDVGKGGIADVCCCTPEVFFL